MIKRFIPILLSVLLLSLTAHAAADLPGSVTVVDITERQTNTLPEYLPTDIQTKTDDDGTALLLKMFEVGANVSPEVLVESGLTHSGIEYELRDVLRSAAPDGQEKKTASQAVTITSESDKREDIVQLLPEGINYAEDGFTGQLFPDIASITAEVEGTESYSYTVTETREYPGLIRNDPYLIPKTVQKGGVTLTLSDVKWSPGADIDPNPASYHATALYKGAARGSRPIEYTVTAIFSGEVVKTVPGNVLYTLVYAAKPVVLEEIPEGVNWTPVLFGLGSAVILGGIGTAVFFSLRRRRAVPAYTDEVPEIQKKRMRIPNMLNEMEDDDGQD